MSFSTISVLDYLDSFKVQLIQGPEHPWIDVSKIAASEFQSIFDILPEEVKSLLDREFIQDELLVGELIGYMCIVQDAFISGLRAGLARSRQILSLYPSGSVSFQDIQLALAQSQDFGGVRKPFWLDYLQPRDSFAMAYGNWVYQDVNYGRIWEYSRTPRVKVIEELDYVVSYHFFEPLRQFIQSRVVLEIERKRAKPSAQKQRSSNSSEDSIMEEVDGLTSLIRGTDAAEFISYSFEYFISLGVLSEAKEYIGGRNKKGIFKLWLQLCEEKGRLRSPENKAKVYSAALNGEIPTLDISDSTIKGKDNLSDFAESKREELIKLIDDFQSDSHRT